MTIPARALDVRAVSRPSADASPMLEAVPRTTRDRVPRNRPAAGHLRFDRRFPKLGIPRLQRSSGTDEPDRFLRLNRVLTDLARTTSSGRVALRAFAEDQIGTADLWDYRDHLDQLVDHLSAGRLPLPGPTLTLAERAEAIPTRTRIALGGDWPRDLRQEEMPFISLCLEHTLPSLGALAPATRRRYVTSLKTLVTRLALFRVDRDVWRPLLGRDSLWDVLEEARIRALTVADLYTLAHQPPGTRRAALRALGVRVLPETISRLEPLTDDDWDRLARTAPHLPPLFCLEALDAMSDSAFASLQRAARKLPADFTLAELDQLTAADWEVIAAAWAGSGADWNHMRRVVSACLTQQLGSVRHPLRAMLMRRIPLKPEVERLPDVTPALVREISAHLPESARAYPLAIVLTGARPAEFCALDERHLKHRTHAVIIPGTKTSGSAREVQIPPAFWPVITDAIPSRHQYGWLRREWRQACEAAGVQGLRLHDLRHAHAMFAIDGGAPERSVQVSLGHTTEAMTRRYTKKRQQRDVATALERALAEAFDMPGGVPRAKPDGRLGVAS